MNRKQLRGFTLTELVIVVAIIAILAAVAYPAYTDQMQESRRAECTSALTQLASAMERDFSRNGNQYQDITGTPAFPATNCPLDGGTPTYNLAVAITNAAATTFTLTAVPVNAQVNDRCGNLTLTNLLVKGQGTGTVDLCWR